MTLHWFRAGCVHLSIQYGYIFSCHLENVSHPSSKMTYWQASQFSLTFLSHHFYSLFYVISSPFLLFLSLFFCFLTALFFQFVNVFLYFPRQISPANFSHLEKLPQPHEKFTPTGGGGGLFQDNIRAWIQVERKFRIELFR